MYLISVINNQITQDCQQSSTTHATMQRNKNGCNFNTGKKTSSFSHLSKELTTFVLNT